MGRTTIRFIDDYWLSSKSGVSHRFFTPAPCSVFERPGIYPSACFCPEDGKYRLWYEYLPDFSVDAYRLLCLAESDDGINWRDTEAVPRTDGMPIVFTNRGYGIHGSCVYRDTNPAASSLYRLCGLDSRLIKDGYASDGERLLNLYASPDGTHWDENEPSLVYPYASDTYNCLLYNPVLNEYNVYMRASNMDRRVSVIRSTDLKHWSDPIVVLHPEPFVYRDHEIIQYYAMWAGWFNGICYGTLWLFHKDARSGGGYMDSTLVYSYNGLHWMHTTGAALIPRPLPPDYGCSQLELTSIYPSENGKEYIITGTGIRAGHISAKANKAVFDAQQGKSIALLFYKIRRDGFVGLENSTAKGEITTQLLQLLKDDLTFNICAPTGFVRFQLCGENHKPIPGFTYDDCVSFTGDDTEVVPIWKEHRISELVGRRLSIYCEINNGTLFGISATFRPFIYGPQVSFNDPRRADTVDTH